MTFNEIVRRYSEVSGITITDSKKVCNDMLAIIMETVMNGESVDIYGFGKLDIVESAAREIKGVDGKMYSVPPKRRLIFKTSKAFSNKLSEGL